MVNRRIVANTFVRCFLVPRYWLRIHNRANIWERVKQFMDSKFPTKEELFENFVTNRRYIISCYLHCFFFYYYFNYKIFVEICKTYLIMSNNYNLLFQMVRI